MQYNMTNKESMVSIFPRRYDMLMNYASIDNARKGKPTKQAAHIHTYLDSSKSGAAGATFKPRG